MSMVYPWARYWYPRDEQVHAESGILWLPTGQYTTHLRSDVATLDALSQHNCLILLGEPGAGKTHAVNEYKDGVRDGARFIKVNLGQLGDTSDVRQELFHSGAFQNWLQGNYDLHLVLDSFDECAVTVGKLGTLITRELGKHLPTATFTQSEYDEHKDRFPDAPQDPASFASRVDEERWSVDLSLQSSAESLSAQLRDWLKTRTRASRLYLRAVCRTADFPETFEKDLAELFGSVGVFLLAPLRREDIELAARRHGLDTERFMTEVWRHDVAPLAGNPVTLSLLIHEFESSGNLSAGYESLFVRGSLRLCKEQSRSRIESGHVSALDEEQLLRIAARIAAVLTFSNRENVFTADDLDAKPLDLSPSAVYGRTEKAHDTVFDVNSKGVREALSRGIFSDRGRERRGFIHRQFREFLAAWYLKQRELPVSQLMNLLLHPADGKVIPQLAETAAFLAALVPEVFECLLAADPEVLLRSTLASLPHETRGKLADTLLRQYEANPLPSLTRGVYERLNQLKHPGLAGQLRPYLARPQDFETRTFAMRVARECDVRELASELVTVALDAAEEYSVRTLAAAVAAELGDSQNKLSLRPLLDDADDPSDELKGIALQALWPEHLGASELFEHLGMPKHSGVMGAYGIFLGKYASIEGLYPGFASFLKDDELTLALDWMYEAEEVNSTGDELRVAADTIMSRAWRVFDTPEVARRFARNALRRINAHLRIVGNELDGVEQAFVSELQQQPAKRRRLVNLMIDQRNELFSVMNFLGYQPPLIGKNEGDVLWLLERLKRAAEPDERYAFSYFLEYLLDLTIPSVRDPILQAAQEVKELGKVLNLGPVDLDSELAQKLRVREAKRREIEAQHAAARAGLPGPVAEPLNKACDALTEFNQGDLSAWARVLFYLSMKPGDTAHTRVHDPYTETHPGWLQAQEAFKEDILRAARSYLGKGLLEEEKWRRSGDAVMFPGYSALRLLLSAAPQDAEALPDTTYQIWAGSVLEVLEVPSQTADPTLDMACALYAKAPDATLNAARELLKQEGHYSSVIQKLSRCWDHGIASTFEAELDGALPLESRLEILAGLLQQGSATARHFAANRLERRSESNDAFKEATAVAVTLYMTAPDHGWTTLWPVLQAEETFGRAWIDDLLYRHSHLWATPIRLSEPDTANLFIWLERRYPHAEDPKRPSGVVYSPEHRDHIGSFRDTLLRSLEVRGSVEAVEELRRIQLELPELDWLSRVVDAALVEMRRQTWRWHSPEALLEVLFDPEKRYMRNADELLDVVLESLRRMASKLQHQETPLASFLWNEWEVSNDGEKKTKHYKPKEEEALSDWVKVHLEDDLAHRGIVIGREVKIRKGEYTDVHVTTHERKADGSIGDRIKVIVEVKGHWNDGLKKAMATQLVERYLAGDDCKRGVYLVGWFNSEKWPERPRKTWKFAEVLDELQNQARKLSVEGVRVEVLMVDACYR